ncbi:MAG: helix-turn-helix domain-containing protein [Desulfobacteraceae bacterium]|uniref:Helix-turn-helix domain-containing protein n=1 Tax=Candidatus Desulfacyla euxinica TaxID=2841693 RepID=A0A8J6MYQ7_9DELT|nr:helix-turn-helix domain-containing protein [Candidatus Desulfacyla euxinica]MBL6977998.1 helix-turn-helix domain-containing protein [Desulfobacteraceae bacterium]
MDEVKGKRLLNVTETARYLGIAPGTLYNRSCRKTKHPFPVKAKRVGGSVRFDKKELDAYIDSI